MDTVYALWHRYREPSGFRHQLMLGIYTSRQKAEAGIALLRDQLGFKDHPDGFEIQTMPVDQG